jgi:hypothetical protein
MKTAGRLFAVAVCGAAVGLLLSGCGSPTVPDSYETYNSNKGVFQCKAPSGWERAGGGRDTYISAKFSSGGAEIKISADMKGSLVGDIAAAQNQMAGLGPGEAEELSPIAQVHDLSKKELELSLGEYEEVATETIQCGFGEGRRTEFTTSTTFGGQVHGYLATFLALDRRIMAVAKCPEKYWDSLRPVLEEVINSLGPGQR